MLFVATEDKFGFFGPAQYRLASVRTDQRSNKKNGACSLVRFVDILHRDDGQITIIAKISKGDSGSRCDAQFLDALGRNVQADGHAEQVAIREPGFLNHSVIGSASSTTEQTSLGSDP